MKLSNLLRRISKDVGLSGRGLSTDSPDAVPFQKCLVVSKVTRYEFEQNRHRGATASQLEQVIRSRGSDFDALLHYHRLQKDFEGQVTVALKEMGAKVHVVNRLAYSPSLISWCDVVIPCGGDGTFLLAASRIRDSRKPVIGFNSDPSRSEGRLCLPKWCSRDIRGALTEISEGRFRWLHRSRIRTTLASDEKLRAAVTAAPLDLHKPILPRSVPARYNVTDAADGDDIATTSYGLEQDNEMWKTDKDHDLDRNNTPGIFKRVLPYLALNEVFIGENVSARVSHLQVKMDGDLRPTRTKCSGLCVSTGTGSTSWQLSINSLRSCAVQELLRLWQEKRAGATGGEVGAVPTREEAKELADHYNNSLIFPPDDPRLVYSVRELISADVWPSPKGLKSRGFTTTVHVKSRCVDAGLVIDGGVSFPFNDGTEATLSVYPQDSLRTVTIIRDE